MYFYIEMLEIFFHCPLSISTDLKIIKRDIYLNQIYHKDNACQTNLQVL